MAKLEHDCDVINAVRGNGAPTADIFLLTGARPHFDYNNLRFDYIGLLVTAELCKNK